MTIKGIQTEESIRSDLSMIGVKKNSDLIVHASLTSIGKVQGGYRNVLEALLSSVRPDGTILAPAFNYESIDPARFINPEASAQIEILRSRSKPFDNYLSKSQEGALSDIIRLDKRGLRSNHPVISWAAIGSRAYDFIENTPLDDCDGHDSPIGRIYERGQGQILLIGVDHVKNTSIHLAEALGKLPHYLQEEICYKDSDGKWKIFKGCGDCSNGFWKVRGIIDFERYEVKGKIGNALSHLIDQKPFVDAVKEAIIDKPWVLLCDNPYCGKCGRARKIYGLPPLQVKKYHLKHPWSDLND